MGPILLLHGFLGSAEDFDPLRRLLPRECAVTAPDWPGHGSRGSERDPEAYGLDAHAGLVLRWIDAQDRPGTLLGYSMGGRMLQHALAARPPLPSGWRVVLVSTSTGIDEPGAAANRRRGDAAAARLLREEGMGAFLRYWHNQTFFRPLMALPAPQLAPILARRRAADPCGLALSLEHVGPGSVPSTLPALPGIGGQVDLVAGELDPRYAEHAREMARRIPGARVTVVPGAGHALHLEQPGSLAAVLIG